MTNYYSCILLPFYRLFTFSLSSSDKFEGLRPSISRSSKFCMAMSGRSLRNIF